MSDFRERGCARLRRNRKIEYQRVCRARNTEQSRIEGRAIFHTCFKGKVRDKLHLVFQKNIAASHIRKTVAVWRRILSNGHPENGFQQIARSRAPRKEAD